ncbi:hypothetical protein J6590_004259 [Homalodisca vitripennis]|nr:hypothetical protein J6590_004259 [Homalodisca vitripennis]
MRQIVDTNRRVFGLAAAGRAGCRLNQSLYKVQCDVAQDYRQRGELAADSTRACTKYNVT